MDLLPRGLSRSYQLLLLSILLSSTLGHGCGPQGLAAQEAGISEAQETSRLAVLWSSGDREVALNVAFMYTMNAKRRGWFDEVTLIVWGPSSNLLAQDAELQEYVRQMGEVGVTLVACKACADSYGVSEKLQTLGVEVKYMGVPLTEMLKGDWKVLTF